MKQRLSTITTTIALSAILFFTACKKPDVQTFSYSFNTGQVDASYAYDGTHASTLSLTLELEEIKKGGTTVTVALNNTMSGEAYHVHVHDAADPAVTPNGTPYDEAPNSAIFSSDLDGNGGSVSFSQETSMTIDELIAYEGFIVVHDPLQAISTTDPTTYIILGLFAE